MNVATEHDDAHDGHHICGVGTYLSIFGALMVLTLITVVVAFQDLGPFNNLAALGIAFLKVFLVVTVFMHLRYNAQIIWIVAGASFIWLVIMITFTLSDLMTRGWFPGVPQTWL